MKKISCTFLLILLILSYAIPVNAKSTPTLISEGYTAQQIHYSVYALETTKPMSRIAGNIVYVTRVYTFDGIVSAPRQKYYVEYIDSVIYTGYLSLYSVAINGNKTIATYKGMLTSVS